MQRENISLEKLLTERNIQFKDEYLKNDFMVIPNSAMTIEDISLIKKIRENNKLVILNSDNLTYRDFRGGEYELATFLVREVGFPIMLGILSGLVTYKIISHHEGKKISGAENLKMPRFRLSIHRTEKEEHIVIEGEADDVLKSLEKLEEGNDST